jgi:hypothetical protein
MAIAEKAFNEAPPEPDAGVPDAEMPDAGSPDGGLAENDGSGGCNVTATPSLESGLVWLFSLFAIHLGYRRTTRR